MSIHPALRVFWLLSLLLTLAASARGAAQHCSDPEWSKGCFTTTPGFGALKPQYLKRAKFQRNGFAVLPIGPFESVAINRQGRIIIPGIVSGDFDYTEAEGGVAAFYTPKTNFEKSKCGYFQVSTFSIIIPPVYDICARFNRKVAYVCVDCALDCADCHNYEYYGKQGFLINRKNQIIKRVSLPPVPKCSTVEDRGGFPPDQQCRNESPK